MVRNSPLTARIPTSVPPFDLLSYSAACSSVSWITSGTSTFTASSARLTRLSSAFSLSVFRIRRVWPSHATARQIKSTTKPSSSVPLHGTQCASTALDS